MSDSTNYLLAKLLVIAMCLQLLVIGYVVYNNYKDDRDQANTLREGCERGKKDRRAAATVNKNIVIIFKDSQKSSKMLLTPVRHDALAKIDHTTIGLAKRAKITCETLFPKVSFP